MKIFFTDREADIMAVLWRCGPSTVAEVRGELHDELAYTTVLTMLRTLQGKGYVGYEEEGRTYRYFAAVEQQDARKSALLHLAAKLFDGSPELLLTHLVSAQKLDRKQLDRIRKLLDEKAGEGPVMTAAWMAYSVAISCLLSIAALAVERACRLRRWPSRWIWTLVLAAPFLLPFTAPVADQPVALVESAATATVGPAAQESVAPAPLPQPAYRMDRLVTSQQVAALLAAMWIFSSALLAAGLAIAWLRMNRRAASWTRRALDGTNVLVSADVGPAVIGFWRSQIVVPEWLLSADQQVRRLALAHESQHVQARDPLLLFAATMAVVLMPWNLPLWWQWRRLRFAIEVDCDTRVLASGHIADVEYAEALLNVAARSSEVPLAAAAMCESASTLEKRIHLFLLDRTTWQRAVALVLLLGGIGVAAAAAQVDAPIGFGQSPKQLISGARGSELVQAIADGDRDAAVALVNDGADVDSVVLGDGSPLIVAARTGDVPLVNLLLERGAQVDIAVRGDGSPLIAASNSGNLEIMTTLVERGADVNGFVLGDETPLINAARAGRFDAVRYLVSSGADVNLAVPAEGTPGAETRSPLGEALKHEHRAVADYLRSQGAQR